MPGRQAPWQPRGLVAVDKQGDRLLFLDPVSLEIESRIENMPTLPHELAIAPDRRRAYVPAYGAGIHGDNPHPNHLVSVINLAGRQRIEDIDLSPLEAPHTLRFGADGLLYICCEDSAAIAVYDAKKDEVIDRIATGSANSHRLCILSSLGLICTDNEEDRSISFISMAERTMLGALHLPEPIAGIAAAPDESRIVASSASRAAILAIDPRKRSLLVSVKLDGHAKPAQVVRYSPDGRWLLAVGDHEPVITLFDQSLGRQTPIVVGEKPMDGAFHPDGRSLLIANEDDGTISVIDLDALRAVRTVPCGTGCETLAYF